MKKAIRCIDCKHCKNERCTKFDFDADMRTESTAAWCKSGDLKNNTD